MAEISEVRRAELIKVRKSALRWYVVLVYPTVAIISFLFVGIAKSLWPTWPTWTYILIGLVGGVVVIAIGLFFMQPVLNRIRRLLSS